MDEDSPAFHGKPRGFRHRRGTRPEQIAAEIDKIAEVAAGIGARERDVSRRSLGLVKENVCAAEI